MTNVLEQFPSKPNNDLIEKFVARLFNSSGVRGRVELAWTDIHPPHKPQYAIQFDLSDLDILAEKASSLNSTLNRNVYIGAGLRRTDVSASSRATDADVISCVACWADFDEDGALDRALAKCSELGIPPNIVVLTGEHPHKRGQMWWVLDEPCDELDRHKVVQKNLARILGGDPTVTNPSRIMRICGSVAWPIKSGRKLEQTRLAEVDQREANYLIEEIERALLSSGSMDTASTPMLDFNTVDAPVNVQEALVKGLEPGKFHLNIRGAVASMLAQGTAPRIVFDVVAAMVRKEGVNVEERLDDLRRLVHGGIEKGIYKPPNAAPLVEGPPAERKKFVFADHAGLMERDPPDWMLEGFLAQKSLAAIYAPPASFKTFLALDMGLCIATGQDWHGRKTARGRVLYIASEGSGSFGFRVQAWANARHGGSLIDSEWFRHLGEDVDMLGPEDLRSLVEAVQEQMPNGVDLMIIDTVARNFGSGDENSTKDMVSFINNVGKLKSILNCAVLVIHHTGKDEAKGGRGSSAMRGALDHEFRLRREDASDRVKLVTTKQKDADEAAPVWLKLGRIEVTHPKTGEVRESLVPVISEQVDDPAPSATNPEAYVGLKEAQLQVLSVVRLNSGRLSSVGVSAEVGKRPDNVGRTLRQLQDRGLVFMSRDGFWHFVNAQPVQQETERNQDDDEM